MSSELEFCRSCQVALLVGAAMDIDWEPEVDWSERVRVCDYAPVCRHVLYELCQAGGLRFIRKVNKRGRRRMMLASPRMIAARANAVWRRVGIPA
ncbi:hypothetical protein ACIBG4_23385 [Nonomuraea sp. NPDC050383]|uniref:hypothetical protein n=1 Tax=Nonomuraea sp. NPDC050383 TaxID=3364362 RepID=UPI0037917B0A